MTVEMEFSTPQKVGLGPWQVELARDLVEQAGYEWGDLEREAYSGTVIVRHTELDTLSQQEEQAVIGFVKDYLTGVTHAETRENV